jgi:hypothetical protein
MNKRLTVSFWIELAVAAVSGLLGLLTLAWRDWIEVVFRVDPDHHNGSAEWLAVFVLLAISVLVGLRARTEWRRVVVGSATQR